jgi:hypothetical protein
LILCCCLSFIPVLLLAQRNVRGTLIDTQTALPVPAATVYISGSSIGTATDSNGFFLLRQVPNFASDLVISAMGYEVEIHPLESGDHGVDLGRIKLQIQPKLLEEVYLSAYDKILRTQRLKEFLQEFVGVTPNSKKTKLLNPNDVHTFLNPQTGVMSVQTDRPLRFINEALGYLINVDLTFFEGSSTNGYRMQGYYYFVPLSGTSRKLRRYEKARKEAYLWSSKRFFHQLYRENPAWQDYDVYRLDRKDNEEKLKIDLLLEEYRLQYEQQKDKVGLKFSDFLADFFPQEMIKYFELVQRQDAVIWTMEEEPLSFAEEVIWENQQAFLKQKGMYGVRLRNKHKKTSALTQDLDAILVFKEDLIHINSNGLCYPPLQMAFGKDWSWNGRLGDMLALEYLPEEE